MSDDLKQDLQFEIAHLLLIDVVGYSKLLVNDQIEVVQELNRIARSSECFRAAEKNGKLIRIPTGDGMALLFFRSPEEPVQCAIEISKALKDSPRIEVRMGIHSGPVNQVTDVNDKLNIAGTGINIAQRVMDCGDAGHILLSKHVAEDLAQYRHWQPYLHDLGECELKHGLRLQIVNLCKDGVGNASPPEKFKRGRRWKETSRGVVRVFGFPPLPGWILAAALFLFIVTLATGLSIFLRRGGPAQNGGATSIPEKSIAVLPFENRSEQQANAYFADGIQDEILTRLSKIADLKVISRTSTQHYKSTPENLPAIGGQLRVAYILEGSVQKIGDSVRVNVQLIRAATDSHVWADSFDRKLTDIFSVESEVAKAIADQLQAKISPNERAAIEKPPTTNLTAYDFYLQAQALWADVSDPIHASEKLPQAAELLGEAVRRDPRFLQAWCLLSRTHGNIYRQGYDRTPARLDQAYRAMQAALLLDPNAGEVHLALASYYYYSFRDYVRARSELDIARRALPNNAEAFQYTGFIDRREGHWPEASRNLERALDLDPRNLYVLEQLALTYPSQRRYADEARAWERVLAIIPGDPLTLMSLAIVPLNSHADIKPYQATLNRLIAQNPRVAPDIDAPLYALCERTAEATARVLGNYPPGGVLTNGINYPHAYWEGVVARWQDDQARAKSAFIVARNEVAKMVEQQPDFAAALSLLGMIDAGLGRKEDALHEGRRACELLPISKDAVDGTAFAVNLAQIYAWVGEKDLAIKQIRAVEDVPNELSYGLIKLHPYWDSLRGDPRFEEIVAALAPLKEENQLPLHKVPTR